MAAGAEEDVLERRDVGEAVTPTGDDVLVGLHEVIGWVKNDPTQVWHENGGPRLGGFAALALHLPLRWQRLFNHFR